MVSLISDLHILDREICILRFSRSKEEIEVSGEVQDTQKRKVVTHGGSKHIGLPKRGLWDRFLEADLLTLRLVKDKEGEWCIVIKRPPKTPMQGAKK